jgi:hypothetical protein
MAKKKNPGRGGSRDGADENGSLENRVKHTVAQTPAQGAFPLQREGRP